MGCRFLEKRTRLNEDTIRRAVAKLIASGRRKGGGIVRSRHETVPNPSARYVPFLTDADLARMIGFDPDDRRRRHDAREAFERLSADGVLDLRRARRGFQFFGRRPALTDAEVAEICASKRTGKRNR